MKIRLLPTKPPPTTEAPRSRKARVLAGLMGMAGTLCIFLGSVEVEAGDRRFRYLMFAGLALSITGVVLHLRRPKNVSSDRQA